MTRYLVFAALFFGVVSSFADRPRADQPVHKPAWEWNDADRLSQRFNPDRMREREAAYRATPEVRADAVTQRTVATDNADRPSDRVTSYVIDGRRNPELFLPHELFDQLVTGLMPDSDLASKQRQFYGPGIRSLGFDEPQFWDRLERVAGQYVQKKYEQTSGELDGNNVTLCRARYEAIKEARQTFGHVQFDRVLYTVIAPTTRFSASTNSSDPATPLVRAAGGCQ